MPDLSELLRKIESASGADREIDYDLCLLFDDDKFRHHLINGVRSGRLGWHESEMPDAWCISFDSGSGSSMNGGIVKRTASIDAALALVERVLPGAYVHGASNLKRKFWTFAFTYDDDKKWINGTAPTAPLAIIAALLRAKLSEQGDNNG